MGFGKRRPGAHIVGDDGVRILERLFPKEWVVRKYIPDYGIDLCVELFSSYKDGYITKGEHIFFQVKGTENINKGKFRVKVNDADAEIEVIKYPIDTNLLSTVETMGSAVPVILAVVDTVTEEAYFICLNDYIDRVIMPNDANYQGKGTKIVYIPISNLISEAKGISAIEWYAKRPKLYALFNLINSQNRTLKYCNEYELDSHIKQFLKKLLRYDAWSATEHFGAIQRMWDEIKYYLERGITKHSDNLNEQAVRRGIDIDEPEYEATFCNSLVSMREANRIQGLHNLWDRLALMGDIFEDTGREVFLPTNFGILISELQ